MGAGVGVGAGAGEGAGAALGAVGDETGLPPHASAASVRRRTAACRTGRIVLVRQKKKASRSEGYEPRALSARERVGEPNLDERLPCDADAFRLAVDGLEQINREVHVDALSRVLFAPFRLSEGPLQTLSMIIL